MKRILTLFMGLALALSVSAQKVLFEGGTLDTVKGVSGLEYQIPREFKEPVNIWGTHIGNKITTSAWNITGELEGSLDGVNWYEVAFVDAEDGDSDVDSVYQGMVYNGPYHIYRYYRMDLAADAGDTIMADMDFVITKQSDTKYAYDYELVAENGAYVDTVASNPDTLIFSFANNYKVDGEAIMMVQTTSVGTVTGTSGFFQFSYDGVNWMNDGAAGINWFGQRSIVSDGTGIAAFKTAYPYFRYILYNAGANTPIVKVRARVLEYK